jgi:hypothetical protein
VETLRRWITEGAEFREHWAFRPVERPEPPTSTASNPIDAFVRNTLARRGLAAPSQADKRTLLRRATYGVTGLPPTEQETRDFLADDSPQAWEKVVDRLLASPHYGEKWARHWLDLVRYADTNSFERDGKKPHAWRYRDYVIRSFNDDKPYDRFVREQLAGEEMADDQKGREGVMRNQPCAPGIVYEPIGRAGREVPSGRNSHEPACEHKDGVHVSKDIDGKEES